MLTIPSDIAPEVHAGIASGEREALHRLYNDFAPALVDAASAEVQSATAAEHVVDHLFERAWTERAKLSTPALLHGFLVAEVHVMALHAQARRASLHRFEQHEQVAVAHTAARSAAFDRDAGWQRVLARIAAAEADPAAVHEVRHEASRHGTAAHLAGVGKGIPRKFVIGGVVVAAVVMVGAILLLEEMGEGSRVTQALADKAAQAIITRTGQRGDLVLDDGTKVTLGADATLTVPKAFNRTMRAVRVVGAARFVVAANAKLPFEVRAGRMQAVATGTTFTVSAYDDTPVVLSVQEGSVQVTVGGTPRTVQAGGGLMVAADGALTEPTAGRRDEATTWADGQLTLVDRPLRDVLPMLRRWYQLDLRPAEALLDRSVTMTAKLGFADSAIVALEQAALVKQLWAGKQMILVDAPKAPR